MSTRNELESVDTRRSGFSLMELIVAITIMTILAGAAVPVASKFFTHQARSATKDELQLLSDASAAFFHDCGRLPTDVAELLVDPGAGDPGWSGPYLPGVVTDELSGLSGYQVDAWSRPYSMSVTGDVLTIASMGQDAQSGTVVDITIDLNVTPIRRTLTLEKLEIINQAVQQYNAQFLATDPLPANWTVALSKIVTQGFLPSATDYELDAWGVSFVEDPAGSTPVVSVTSTALE